MAVLIHGSLSQYLSNGRVLPGDRMPKDVDVVFTTPHTEADARVMVQAWIEAQGFGHLDLDIHQVEPKNGGIVYLPTACDLPLHYRVLDAEGMSRVQSERYDNPAAVIRAYGTTDSAKAANKLTDQAFLWKLFINFNGTVEPGDFGEYTSGRRALAGARRVIGEAAWESLMEQLPFGGVLDAVSTLDPAKQAPWGMVRVFAEHVSSDDGKQNWTLPEFEALVRAL